MAFLDLVEKLISEIDLAKSEVVHPKSLLFLCGGREGAAIEPVPSMREALLRRLPDRATLGESRIILAEKAVQALADTHFENLLDLEECISSIVDAVVLIVESAGSICELGAFTKTPEIRRKLVVIMQDDHSNQQSFITLGPINYLKGFHQDRELLPYNWRFNDSVLNVPGYVIDAMMIDIPEAVKKIPKREAFNREELGHRIFLALAFCHILRGAKLGELKVCFDKAGFEIKEKEIRKILDTLQICDLLKKVSAGPKRVHYISTLGRMPMEIAFMPGVDNRERDTLRRLQSISQAITKEDAVRMEIYWEHNNAP